MSEAFRRPAPLDDRHSHADFDCGVADLNVWLKERAAFNQREGFTRTFVIARADFSIAAYASLAASTIQRDDLPRRARIWQSPREIPVILIARLAADVKHQGTGLGAAMLQGAVKVALGARKLVAARALIVDASTERAADFYLRHGFQTIAGEARRLFLPFAAFDADDSGRS
jgi:GNAT superfamily N-acetyltransferase